MLAGNQFDPTTPLSWTRRLAVALGMDETVFRYEGGGHLAYARRGNAFVDKIGEAYPFDLTLPPDGSAYPAILRSPLRRQARVFPILVSASWTVGG